MTIANCPRCREQVTVPERVAPQATVCCPLCRDEYELADALRELPPALIVLSGGDEPSAEADANSTPWPAFDLDREDGEEVSLAPAEGTSAVAPFDFASGSAPGDGKPTATIRSSSRRRKPKGSPVKSILSVAIGGMMAFPIAQLILWHLPGDLKRDFGAGPIVAQYAPQIVPMKFRGDAAIDDSEVESSLPEVESEFSFRGNNEFSNSINNAPANNSNDRKIPTTLTPTTGDLQTDAPMNLDAAAAAGADVFGAPLDDSALVLGELPVIDQPKLELRPLRDPPLTIEAPNIESPNIEAMRLKTGSVRNAPTFDADSVAQRLQSAVSGNEAWDAEEASSPSNQVRLQFYSSLSSLGEALTFADQSSSAVKDQMKATSELLEQIAVQAAKIETIGAVASRWISWDIERRRTNGVCLYGVVKSVDASGDLSETVVESNGQEIAVVSMSDPIESLAVGRKVLILGSILENPKENLGGYHGTRSVIVLDGYHVNVVGE